MAKSKKYYDEDAPPPPPEEANPAPAPAAVAIPKGSNQKGRVPPSLRGTSQDPSRKQGG